MGAFPQEVHETLQVTLESLLQALKRHVPLILGLAFLGGALGYWAAACPLKRYQAEAVLRVTVEGPTLPSPKVATLPREGEGPTLGHKDLEALALGLSVHLKGLGTLEGARVRWNREAQVLHLEAQGPTPETALRKAQSLLAASQAYLEGQTQVLLQKALKAEPVRTTQALAQVRRELALLEQALSPKSGPENGLQAALLEAQGVPPPVARSPSPAQAYLELRRAELKAQAASLEAHLALLEEALTPQRLAQEAARMLGLRALAAPTLPKAPVGLPPSVGAILGFLAGLFLGLALAWIRSAVTLSRPQV